MVRRLVVPIATLLACVCAAAPASARIPIRVGIGDQQPSVFADARLKALKLPVARLIVPYDAATSEPQAVQTWLDAVAADGMTPEVAFEHLRGNGCPGFPCTLPSRATYRANVAALIARWPQVRTYTAWNEANHVSQPTYKSPKLAVKYWKAMKSVCKRCTVLAADFLDQRNIDGYLRKFQKASKHKGRIWGLHNYNDVNRNSSKGIRRVLAVTRGQLWLTETGGLVQFKTSGFRYSTKRAAKATKYLFQLAKKYKRIKRIYVYRWFGEPRSARFDAGLVGPNGETRPGLKQFKKSIKHLPR